MSRLAIRFVVCLFLVSFVQAAHGQVTISGSPLTITIAGDTSFQVRNSKIVGGSGQIYRAGCTTGADSGIFAAFEGKLYAPNFAAHTGTCASSTGSIGAYTAWSPISISPVSGSGAGNDPYRVTVVVNAGTTGVQLTATYTYVNGEEFFRLEKKFCAATAKAMEIYLAADIFLGTNDWGIPYLEPSSQSPGGKTQSGTYTILFIPTTPATSHLAALYSTVWTAIGQKGSLSNAVAAGFIDNGAALHWHRNVAANSCTTITSVISFGAIPIFNVLSVSPPQGTQGQTLTIVVTGIGFQSGTTFNFGPGITITSTTINSSTQATLTITIATNATPGPRDVIGTQSTGGPTSTLDDGFTVIALPPPSCARILAGQVHCEVGPNGQPTGNYVWDFRIQNLSGIPISHLYFTDLPPGVTVTPSDHVTFNNPVTGISPPIHVVLHGGSPGPLSFTLSLQDRGLAECCTLDVTLELPACNCAQIVTDVEPACFTVPWTSTPPPYPYKVTLQNLSPINVEHVVIAAVSPIDKLTPVPPSLLTVTQDVFPVPTTGQGGTIGPLTLKLSGPQAIGGSQVCLRIGLHAEDPDDCCSIVRCFMLPSCFIDWQNVDDLGDAFTTPNGSGFTIGNIGSSGADGARLHLDDARAAELTWLPLDAAGALPNGAWFEVSAAGNSGEPTGNLRVTQQNGSYQVASSIDDAATYTVEVFEDGEPTGTATNQPGGGTVVVVWPVSAGVEIVGTPGKDPERLAFTLVTDRSVPWRLADGTTLTGNRYRISPEQGEGPVSLQTLDLRAANIPTITITATRIFHDCNANGQSDADDIASGSSTDDNANGIPDECELGADLNVSLNTGFNEESGELLPFGTLPNGTDDDDWTIISPGAVRPAKVVINPFAVWGAALPDTRWISVNPNQGASQQGTTKYERCFCLGPNATDVSLDLQWRADDVAAVYLNDQLLGGPGGSFAGSQLSVQRTGRVGDGLFLSGQNCVRVEVHDIGIVGGFTLAGSVVAAHGACPSIQ
jgi:hypothetical protein